MVEAAEEDLTWWRRRWAYNEDMRRRWIQCTSWERGISGEACRGVHLSDLPPAAEREAEMGLRLHSGAQLVLAGLRQRARVVAGLLRPRQSAARLRPTTHE